MQTLSRRLDRMLPRIVMIAAVLLLFAQMALRSPLFWAVFSRVDRLEGTRQEAILHLASWERYLSWRVFSDQTPVTQVSLELLQPQPNGSIKLLVNGEIRGSFTNSSLTVGVNVGDLLEIDAVDEFDAAVVRVKDVSSDLGRPVIGQLLQVKQEIRPLGKVDSKGGR